MTSNFDPYYTWLGIPTQEQPADYYRLLGLNRFETDPDVIQNAAEMRIWLLRAKSKGPLSEYSHVLLREVATASGCLMHDESKRTYDAQLRSDGEVEPPPRMLAPERELATDAEIEALLDVIDADEARTAPPTVPMEPPPIIDAETVDPIYLIDRWFRNHYDSLASNLTIRVANGEPINDITCQKAIATVVMRELLG